MEKFTILLVDDIDTNLIFLGHIIKATFDNVNVLEAMNVKDAIKEIMKNKVDFIITDVQMPEASGYDLAKYLEDIEETKEIPIMMISAVYEDDKYKKMAFESSKNVIDFVTKPVNSEILCGKLKAFVNIFERMKKNKNELEKKEEELKNNKKIIAMHKKLGTHFNKNINIDKKDIMGFLSKEEDYIFL